jgi:hypothetical protein
MRRLILVQATAVLALVVAWPETAAARRLICRDGDPNTILGPRGGAGPAFCNHDTPGDGVCRFAVCSRCPFIRGCVGPEAGVCPARPLPPSAVVVDVAERRRRVSTIGTARVVFRFY